jgi:hypothetical protein
MSEIIQSVSERETTAKVWGITWKVVVTLWEDQVWTIFAESLDAEFTSYTFDPLWEGDHEPDDKEVFDKLDEAMQIEAETRWESFLSSYYGG